MIGVSDNVLLAERSPPPVNPAPAVIVRVVGTAPIVAGVMALVDAAVIRPYVSTVNVATSAPSPYDPAVTPVVGNEIVPVVVIVPPLNPLPAVTLVTVPDPNPWLLT